MNEGGLCSALVVECQATLLVCKLLFQRTSKKVMLYQFSNVHNDKAENDSIEIYILMHDIRSLISTFWRGKVIR